MKLLSLIIILFSGISATNFSKQNLKDIQEQFNNQNRGWKIKFEDNYFDFTKPETLTSYLGRDKSFDNKRFLEAAADGLVSLRHLSPSDRLLQTIPASYNLTTVYPNCWSISYIRNQGQCGSCWAVTTGSVISDRFCVKNYNNGVPKQRQFSYQDLLECCGAGNCYSKNGCKGGSPTAAFYFAKTTGLVRGENHNNSTNCKPYFLSPSAPSSLSPSCRLKCTNSTSASLNRQLYPRDKMKITSYGVADRSTYGANMVQIGQTAILNGGSILSYLTIYNDFFGYSSGVYTVTPSTVQSPNPIAGYHVVRLVGWGTLGTVDYWIAANTWGAGWGMNGYVLIKRGSNEADIEDTFIDAMF